MNGRNSRRSEKPDGFSLFLLLCFIGIILWVVYTAYNDHEYSIVKWASILGIIVLVCSVLDLTLVPKPKFTTYDQYYGTDPEKNKMRPVLITLEVMFIAVLIVFLTISPSSESGNAGSVLPSQSTSSGLSSSDSRADDDLSFTVYEMQFARHNGNLKYMENAQKGLINCCVYADVTNPTDKAIDLTKYEMYLTCDDDRYDPFFSDDPAFLCAYRSVASGESIKLKVIDFQIPAALQNADTQIKFVIESPKGTRTTWKLR